MARSCRSIVPIIVIGGWLFAGFGSTAIAAGPETRQIPAPTGTLRVGESKGIGSIVR